MAIGGPILLEAAEDAIRSTTRPMTGREVPGMEEIERVMICLMEKWEIPGGAVAVSYQGRLVYARGFGWADLEKKRPVRPDDLFRIASVSKPLTSVTILTLLDDGLVDLEDPFLKYLEDEYQPFDGKPIDPRLRTVTLRQLLQHTGGFDRDASFDPMFQPQALFDRLGRPAEVDEVIRFMLSRPLDFAPGERYVYSNFGYCLLGRVIEKVTGKSYEAAVRERVLSPAGARRTCLGKTCREGRVEAEVIYYATDKNARSKSIFANSNNGLGEEESPPYGSFYLKPMDSHGGWISSTIDLLRFTNSADGRRMPALLKPETSHMMIHDTLKMRDGKRSSYALGWGVTGEGEQVTWEHAGSLPGTATFLVNTEDGSSCAVLLNRRADPSDEFFDDLTRNFTRALREMPTWPTEDRFGEYP